jgi:hypothetical protein
VSRRRSSARRVDRGLVACAVAALACCALLAPAGRARAFSDRQRFDEASGTGGGGGRYFTGSPVDGYSCAVCHRGGPEPHVRIAGLPLAGYKPGATYNVEISWDNTPGWHAVQLEFIGRNALAAGKVSQFSERELDVRSRCGSQDMGDLADYLIEKDGRQVMGITGCGASTLRFHFTAPDAPDLAFSASVVLLNGDRLAEGDGVQDIKHVLRRSGEPAPSASSSCSIARAPDTAGWSPCAFLGLAALLAYRRRRA